MHSLPKEYRELLERFAIILHSKPKRGYFESIVESGKPDPLDPIEEASMALGVGKKTAALNILENAHQDPEKKSLLNYIDELESVLEDLIESIKSLPEPESKPIPSSSSSSRKTSSFIIVVAILFVAAVLIYYFKQ